MSFNNPGKGCLDVYRTLRQLYLPLYLARADIRQRYRRSTLGPFWITISTGIMVATIGIIFGQVFKAPMAELLPFLAAGLVIWSFISSTLTEATEVFVGAQAIIRQLPIPLFVHVLRLLAKNFYIFLHNIVIFFLVLLYFHEGLGLVSLLSILGLILLILNLSWLSLLLGIVCSRFRDLTQIVASLLQIFFYLTPIIWLPSLLPEKTSMMVLTGNPFFHLIEVVRAPLLNQVPTSLNWIFTIVFAILGWLFTIFIFNRYRSKIAYWL